MAVGRGMRLITVCLLCLQLEHIADKTMAMQAEVQDTRRRHEHYGQLEDLDEEQDIRRWKRERERKKREREAREEDDEAEHVAKMKALQRKRELAAVLQCQSCTCVMRKAQVLPLETRSPRGASACEEGASLGRVADAASGVGL